MKTQLILSCEHASNKIPKRFAALFENSTIDLLTHKGFDIGAKTIYNAFLTLNPVHAQYANYSRLLIELNRTLNHPKIFSMVSSQFDNKCKQYLIHNYYLPYLNQLESAINANIKKNSPVIHLSIHSFTPEYNNLIRKNHIGLLYDSKRLLEKNLCYQWKNMMHVIAPNFLVRMNYPYRGSSNGLTSYFRKCFPLDKYFGIELEINQGLFDNKNIINKLKHLLVSSFKEVFTK